MRVTALIDFLNDLMSHYGDVEITSLASIGLPPTAALPFPLSPLLGSDDDDTGPRLYVVTTQTGVSETFEGQP